MGRHCMSEDVRQADDQKLSILLRAARPTAGFPPGFQNAVWRRIESGYRKPMRFVERLAGLLLNPRFAAAGLAAVVLIAAGVGAVRGIRSGEQEARDRYLALVDPSSHMQH